MRRASDAAGFAKRTRRRRFRAHLRVLFSGQELLVDHATDLRPWLDATAGPQGSIARWFRSVNDKSAQPPFADFHDIRGNLKPEGFVYVAVFAVGWLLTTYMPMFVTSNLNAWTNAAVTVPIFGSFISLAFRCLTLGWNIRARRAAAAGVTVPESNAFIDRMLAVHRCPCCGHDLAGPLAADDGLVRCPECAARWRPQLGTHADNP